MIAMQSTVFVFLPSVNWRMKPPKPRANNAIPAIMKTVRRAGLNKNAFTGSDRFGKAGHPPATLALTA